MAAPAPVPAALWKRALRTAGGAAAACFLLGAGFVMLFEDSFIYFPERGGVERSPAEDVFLEASDGVRLHGWYAPAPEGRPTLLWFHGNAGNLEYRRDMFQRLRAMPAGVFLLDYRGYGRSEGKPSEEGLYRDARAAWEWLAARTPPRRIVVFGKSLGSAPACELACRVPCGGLILQSAFTSAPDMAWRVLPLFPARWFMRTKFDNLSKIPRVACPKLFLHSRSDEIVPFAMGERLFAAAGDPKEAAWFDGAGHNDLWIVREREYYDRMARFLDRCGGGS